jgi:hypothetical protein
MTTVNVTNIYLTTATHSEYIGTLRSDCYTPVVIKALEAMARKDRLEISESEIDVKPENFIEPEEAIL